MKAITPVNKNAVDRKKESGMAMIEFAIVFPLLFFLFLTIIQITMLYIAKQMVNYAAFYAARSATVWVPEYDPKRTDTKVIQEKIERAASIACIPLAPKYNLNSAVSVFARYPIQVAKLVSDLYMKCPEMGYRRKPGQILITSYI